MKKQYQKFLLPPKKWAISSGNKLETILDEFGNVSDIYAKVGDINTEIETTFDNSRRYINVYAKTLAETAIKGKLTLNFTNTETIYVSLYDQTSHYYWDAKKQTYKMGEVNPIYCPCEYLNLKTGKSICIKTPSGSFVDKYNDSPLKVLELDSNYIDVRLRSMKKLEEITIHSKPQFDQDSWYWRSSVLKLTKCENLKTIDLTDTNKNYISEGLFKLESCPDDCKIIIPYKNLSEIKQLLVYKNTPKRFEIYTYKNIGSSHYITPNAEATISIDLSKYAQKEGNLEITAKELRDFISKKIQESKTQEYEDRLQTYGPEEQIQPKNKNKKRS